MIYFVTISYILLVAQAVAALLTADNSKYLRAKSCASFGFLLLGMYAYFSTGSELYFALLPAYVCCFIGDVLLGIAHEKKQFFIPGMIIFMCAHFFFISTFLGWREKVFDGHIFWIVIALLIGLPTLASMFTPKLMDYGHKKIPVVIYAFTVGMFGGCGLDIALTQGASNPGYLVLGIGAILFMLSDCVLNLKYFRTKKRKWYPPFVTISYYIAMYLTSMFYVFI